MRDELTFAHQKATDSDRFMETGVGRPLSRIGTGGSRIGTGWKVLYSRVGGRGASPACQLVGATESSAMPSWPRS